MIDPDWAGSPAILAAVFVLVVAVLVARAIRKDRREYRRFKRYRSTVRRQRMYRKWLIDSFVTFGGSSVVLLALVWQYVPRMLADIEAVGWVAALRAGFAASGWLGPAIVIGVGLLVVGGSTAAIFAVRASDDVPTIGDIAALLPRNRRELTYGALLSLNAGVVEELMFRLAFPAIIFGITGDGITAVTISLALFGLLHVYQGIAGVVGSTLVGALLMAFFLSTGNIVTAIVAHALIDLRSLVLIPVVVGRVHEIEGQDGPRKRLDTPHP